MSRLMDTVEDALRSYKNNDVDLEQARDIIMWEVSDLVRAKLNDALTEGAE